jgi:hypothetical protein
MVQLWHIKKGKIMKIIKALFVWFFVFSSICFSQVMDERGGAIQITSDSVITLLGRVMGVIGFADTTLLNDIRWKQVTNLTGDLFKDIDTRKMTYLLGDTLRLDIPGSYLILGGLSLQSPTGIGRKWALGIAKNGEILIPYSERGTSAGASDVGYASILTYCDAEVGDKLTFEVINLTDSAEIVPRAASLLVLRLLY